MPASRLTPLALAVALPLVAGCAATPDGEERLIGVAALEGDPRLGEQTDRACFTRTIDRFSMPDDRTVVLEAGPNRHYLVEVFGACIHLDRAETIGVVSRTSCLTKGDALIVSDSAFSLRSTSGIGPQRCLIKGIYDWDEDAEAEETEDVEPTEAGETGETI